MFEIYPWFACANYIYIHTKMPVHAYTYKNVHVYIATHTQTFGRQAPGTIPVSTCFVAYALRQAKKSKACVAQHLVWTLHTDFEHAQANMLLVHVSCILHAYLVLLNACPVRMWMIMMLKNSCVSLPRCQHKEP